MMTYCEISSTPQYQFTLGELIRLDPSISSTADQELFRDYMEYERLREAQEVYDKLKKNYFSTITQPKQVFTGEVIEMSNKAKFQSLGISVPKKQISNQQVINLKKIISQKNNDFAKTGVDRVFMLN